MFNSQIVKQASEDLNAIESHQVVKVASIISRLKAWYNSLFDSEYKMRVQKLQSDSAIFKTDMQRLERYMSDVSSAIETGDIDKYNIALENLKTATQELSRGLDVLSKDAAGATAPPEAQGVDRGSLQVIFRPGTLEHPGTKVPLTNALKSSGVSPEDIDAILKDPQFLKDVEAALMSNGKMIGSAVSVKGGKNDKRVGEMYVSYDTSFTLTNYPIALQMQVILTDQSGRENNPRPIMSVTRISSVKAKKITTSNIDECLDCGFIKKEALDARFKDFEGTSHEWKFDLIQIEKMRKKYNWSNYVKPQITKISKSDFISAAQNIWSSVFKDVAMNNTAIEVLFAQASLETGGFKYMYNYNLGNVKASTAWSMSNKWTGYNCGENLNGKNVKFSGEHPVCFFRAYDSLEDGMLSYLKLFGSEKYRSALLAATTGDTDAFVSELKEQGYFTGNTQAYSKAVKDIYNSNTNEASNEETDEVNELMSYLDRVANPLTEIVKQSIASSILPESQLSIKIKTNIDSYPAMTEYASVLAAALESGIDANTNIHSDGSKIEVSVSTVGPIDSVIQAVSSIEKIVSLAFSRKYSGLLAFGSIKKNASSDLSIMSELKIDRERRKFYLNTRL